MVPVLDVRLEVALEALEVVSVAPSEELVLDMAEDLLGRVVVDAAALARHALADTHPLEPVHKRGALVLPTHARLHDGRRALGHSGLQHVEHLLLLGEVGALRDEPRHDLLAAKVVGRRKVRLAEGESELGGVGTHLLPQVVGGEVSPEHVLEGLANLPSVGVVPVVVDLAAHAAAQPHLIHDLECRLVRDPDALLGARAHGGPPVTAAAGALEKISATLGHGHGPVAP